MRADTQVNEILSKCDILKRAGLWPAEPKLRPRAWLKNFDDSDTHIAAFLLDKFTFYNKALTDALLVAAYNSIGDGMSKGPLAPCGSELVGSISSAVLTPVRGEEPNPTDSGYFLCRSARQLLHLNDKFILDSDAALEHAYTGGTVIFIDDFVGSGDQFLSTWKKSDKNRRSFEDAQSKIGFTAIYVTLVTTDFGLDRINIGAPHVAVCATHVLSGKSTISGVLDSNPNWRAPVVNFLTKYSHRLAPTESYMVNNQEFMMFGYKKRGLMFGFEHSIPDATLPIFWSPGLENWEPLIERT
ncbi:phosphoribosyltransferase-like protein [Halopseudomonas aestusnigri]|uniref:PRTase-CE domain-containing protein n=1 Tax=Halopseudomonas aestusnigri TaxID=857252 RepID=A0AAQ1JQL3_9GAMM|nr:hypothetical protein [Halopseudomonas aestusnigri]OWL86679.1 hypothetical protein B7O88_11760 [Halopseudomonas aestusnigri]SEG48825.1 hypothetical protein SAMN05216586_1084 [Halopseudomonas aestusnigri]